jgi:hypothetical protein
MNFVLAKRQHERPSKFEGLSLHSLSRRWLTAFRAEGHSRDEDQQL